MIFEWDDANVEHIARHGIEPEEVEGAMTDPKRLPAGAYNTPAERRWSIIGATEDGRILCVIYTTRGKRFRVVTARDASLGEKRRYKR